MKKKSKQPTNDDFGNPIKPGETIRFMCDGCRVEFIAFLSGVAKDDAESAEHMRAQEVGYCPFCASCEVEPC